MAEACPTVPVSIKCRLAAHPSLNDDGSLPAQSFDELCHFIEEVSSSGVTSHVVVHARAAVLSGLSPKGNRAVPPLNHEWVHQLTANFPRLRFTLNGGISSASQIQQLLDRESCKLDGLMVGRWMLRNPLAIWDMPQLLLPHGAGATGAGATGAPSSVRASSRASSRARAIHDYEMYAAQMLDSRRYPASELAMPLILIAESLREADGGWGGGEGNAEQDWGGMSQDELGDVTEALWQAAERLAYATTEAPTGGQDGPPSLRRISKLLARASGAKVSRKIVRNRAEDLGLL